MTTRPAFVQDMEPIPRVFMVEQTDIRGEERFRIMGKLQAILAQRDRKPNDIARDIKDGLEEEFGRHWHVVVGTDYAW